MPTNEIVVKHVPAVRLVEMRAVAASYEPASITPVVGPLFDRLLARIIPAGIKPVGPPIAYYEPADDGVLVHAGCPVTSDLQPEQLNLGDDVHFVELPAIKAATTVHHGTMDHADQVAQELAKWIEANGYIGSGFAREVYLEVMGPREEWVTEFQEPITKASVGQTG